MGESTSLIVMSRNSVHSVLVWIGEIVIHITLGQCSTAVHYDREDRILMDGSSLARFALAPDT